MPYRARPKSPPFNFFRHCETFFRKFFPQKVPLLFFCCFASEWTLESPKWPPFSFFFGTVRFFSENKHFSPFNLLMFCDGIDVEKPQMVPFAVFEPWIWRRLGPVPACFAFLWHCSFIPFYDSRFIIVISNNKPGTVKVGAISKAESCKNGEHSELCESPVGCKM